MNKVLTKVSASLGPLAPFAKAVIPAIVAILTGVIKSIADGTINASSVSIAVSGVVLAVIVYFVPNLAKPVPAPVTPVPSARRKS